MNWFIYLYNFIDSDRKDSFSYQFQIKFLVRVYERPALDRKLYRWRPTHQPVGAEAPPGPRDGAPGGSKPEPPPAVAAVAPVWPGHRGRVAEAAGTWAASCRPSQRRCRLFHLDDSSHFTAGTSGQLVIIWSNIFFLLFFFSYFLSLLKMENKKSAVRIQSALLTNAPLPLFPDDATFISLISLEYFSFLLLLARISEFHFRSTGIGNGNRNGNRNRNGNGNATQSSIGSSGMIAAVATPSISPAASNRNPAEIQQKSSKNPAGIQQESSRNISIWKISSAHRHIHFNKSANERRWAHKSINRQLAIDLPVSALTLQRCHHVSRRSARLRCDLAEVRCEPVTQSVFRYANYAGRNSRCDCELRPCLFLSFFLFHSPVLRISWPGSIQSSLNASHLIHSGMMFSWELNGAMEKFCRALLPNINNIRHWNGWEMVRNFQWRQSPIKRKSNFTSSNDE